MTAALRFILLVLTIAGLSPTAASYDARGNVANNGNYSFAYDHANQPVSRTGAVNATYAYDGNFKRVKTVEGGATVYSFYSRSGGLLFRHNATDPTKNDDYIRLGGLTAARLSGSGSSYAETFLLNDHQCSPVAGANSAGAILWTEKYRPYGQTMTDPAANDNNTGFTGHLEDDALGLIYMQARYYDPLLGRFLSTDPIGYQDQLNLYAYVANDPVNFDDPDGLFLRALVSTFKFGRNFIKHRGNAVQAAYDEYESLKSAASAFGDGRLDLRDAEAAFELGTGLNKKDLDFVSDIARRADKATGGNGTKAHDYAKRLTERYQSLYGKRDFKVERSFRSGQEVGYGPVGSVRLDNYKADKSAIFDYKFGNAREVSAGRADQLRNAGGFSPNTPVVTVRPNGHLSIDYGD